MRTVSLHPSYIIAKIPPAAARTHNIIRTHRNSFQRFHETSPPSVFLVSVLAHEYEFAFIAAITHLNS